MQTLPRMLAGLGLISSLALGGWVASQLTLDTALAAETVMAKRIPPKQAQRQALEFEASHTLSEKFYRAQLDEIVEQRGLPAPDHARLLAPNPFLHAASPGAPQRIAVGASLREGGLSLRVKIEVMDVERGGMRTRSEHTLVQVENVGATPLAYFLAARGRDGDCRIRAVTRLDVMVLLPGERGAISICPGVHAVELTDLRIMEVTALGAMWLRKIPPRAVGHDPISVRSHDPGPDVELCAEIPAAELGARVSAGEIAWEDLIDFYSRHDCRHYSWWPGYTRAVEPLERLPVIPVIADH